MGPQDAQTHAPRAGVGAARRAGTARARRRTGAVGASVARSRGDRGDRRQPAPSRAYRRVPGPPLTSGKVQRAFLMGRTETTPPLVDGASAPTCRWREPGVPVPPFFEELCLSSTRIVNSPASHGFASAPHPARSSSSAPHRPPPGTSAAKPPTPAAEPGFPASPLRCPRPEAAVIGCAHRSCA